MRYRSFASRSRRRSVRPSGPRYTLPPAEPCIRCGDLYHWPTTETVRLCEHCGLREQGIEPKGTNPDGTEPRLIYRYPVVLQRCHVCERFEPLDTTSGDGRCWYCALDGEVTPYGKICEGPIYPTGAVLVTRDGLTVPCGSGLVSVEVIDQTSGPVGTKHVNLRAPARELPRWGQGWSVRTVEGASRWWLTSWDSSD